MSATQHTPGPWLKAVTGNVLDGRGCKVCTVDPLPGMNNREKESNACLIASAPDMLSALEEIASRQISVHGYNSPSALLLRLASVQSLARAAIARATGESITDHRCAEEMRASHPRMTMWKEGEK